MKARFFDRQDAANPLNGKMLSHSAEIGDIIQSARLRAPFMAELLGQNGSKLLLGLGSGEGRVQFSSSAGSPPYLMALGSDPEAQGEQRFLMGDTVTPVSRRYCLPMRKVAAIASVFLDSLLAVALALFGDVDRRLELPVSVR